MSSCTKILDASLHRLKKRRDTVNLFAVLQRKITTLLNIQHQRTEFYDFLLKQLKKKLTYKECLRLKKTWRKKQERFKKEERFVLREIVKKIGK